MNMSLYNYAQSVQSTHTMIRRTVLSMDSPDGYTHREPTLRAFEAENRVRTPRKLWQDSVIAAEMMEVSD